MKAVSFKNEAAFLVTAIRHLQMAGSLQGLLHEDKTAHPAFIQLSVVFH